MMYERHYIVADFIDGLFPLQAHERHVRNVVTGAEAPDGLAGELTRAPIFHRQILDRSEANYNVYVENMMIPPWEQITGIIGHPDSWRNGLGEKVEYVDGKWVRPE